MLGCQTLHKQLSDPDFQEDLLGWAQATSPILFSQISVDLGIDVLQMH